MFCAISICCAASRATWSFARDKAIPLHRVWSKVNHSLGDVPLNANLLVLVIQLLLGLIYIGSMAAFNAFVGVAVMCLGASYAMPIAISLMNGRKDMADAPFSLGRWGVCDQFICGIMDSIWNRAVLDACRYSGNTCVDEWVTPLAKSKEVLPDVFLIDYASVVFIGFAAISAVWYLLSANVYQIWVPSANRATKVDVQIFKDHLFLKKVQKAKPDPFFISYSTGIFISSSL